MNNPDAAPCYVRRSNLVASDMDGETVMMSVERGEYFGLNGLGTRIWNLLERPASEDQIVAAVCREFDVDVAACTRDVRAFLDELLEMDLIERRPSGGAKA